MEIGSLPQSHILVIRHVRGEFAVKEPSLALYWCLVSLKALKWTPVMSCLMLFEAPHTFSAIIKNFSRRERQFHKMEAQSNTSSQCRQEGER